MRCKCWSYCVIYCHIEFCNGNANGLLRHRRCAMFNCDWIAAQSSIIIRSTSTEFWYFSSKLSVCVDEGPKGGRKQYHRNYSIANQMPNEMFFVCICTAFGNFKFCANETEKLACTEILRNWIVEKYSRRVIYCYSNYLRLSLSLRINKQLKQMKRAWDRKRLFQRVCLFIYFFVRSFRVCVPAHWFVLLSIFTFCLSQLKKVIK